MQHSKILVVKDLGETDYKKCWDLQEELFATNVSLKGTVGKENETTNTLLLTEHFPVYTLGKNGNYDNLIVNKKLLGADFYKINRGGDITYHGPGQLVAYPIIDLEKYQIGLAKYIWNIEEVIIRLIAQYGLVGGRNSGASGVWLDIDNPFKIRKICAVGVKASRHITMHGLAFNVSTDLSYFKKIIPCGIANAGVTSLELELNSQIQMSEIKELFVNYFNEVFDIPTHTHTG
jgi:lipoyl(octanoyl) transferase